MNSEITILGIALGLGLLVGLQREREQSRMAGIRTFGLVTVFGALSGLIHNQVGQGWILVAGVLSIAVLMAVANIIQRDLENPRIGQTTEIAALLMYMVGIYLAVGNIIVGIVIGAAIAVLLYLKEFFTLHISQLGEKDLRAFMVFVAVSLVILPILPDETFGPYDVLSLREIWLMVVLIVGISVSGYFAYKWLGKKVGTGLSGILGGLISSTATTITYSRLSKDLASSHYLSAFIIIAASAVSIIRIIVELLVVTPKYIATLAPPLLIVAAVMGIASLIFFFKSNNTNNEPAPDPQNPAQFKTALIFAILYAVILVLLAYVKDSFGSGGLYVVSLLSGLTDVDAITLSLANTMNDGGILASEGWKYILVAALSNLMFKGGIIVVWGHRRLLKIIFPVFLLTLLTGIVVLFFW